MRIAVTPWSGSTPTRGRLNAIRAARSPVGEFGLDALIGTVVEAGRLTATTDAPAALAATDVTLICVGTPSRHDGAVNLDGIQAVTTQIAASLRRKSSRHIVVLRSTVPPGTTRNLVAAQLASLSGKSPGTDFGVAFNPEFLREGSGIEDFNDPAKTMVGAIDARTADQIMSLYGDLPGPRIITGIETAESREICRTMPGTRSRSRSRTRSA